MTLPSGYLSREQREKFVPHTKCWSFMRALQTHANVVDLILEEKDREIARLNSVLVSGPDAPCCRSYRGHDYNHEGVCVRGCGIPEDGFVYRLQGDVHGLAETVKEQSQTAEDNKRLLEECAAAVKFHLMAAKAECWDHYRGTDLERSGFDRLRAVLAKLQAVGIGK